jgi:hypothetical protein
MGHQTSEEALGNMLRYTSCTLAMNNNKSDIYVWYNNFVSSVVCCICKRFLVRISGPLFLRDNA